MKAPSRRIVLLYGRFKKSTMSKRLAKILKGIIDKFAIPGGKVLLTEYCGSSGGKSYLKCVREIHLPDVVFRHDIGEMPLTDFLRLTPPEVLIIVQNFYDYERNLSDLDKSFPDDTFGFVFFDSFTQKEIVCDTTDELKKVGEAYGKETSKHKEK